MLTAIRPEPVELSQSNLVVDSPARVVEEHRASPRVRKRFTVSLLGMGCNAAVEQCCTDNISEDGMFVQAPPAYGLRVGQRCEVVLTDERGSAASSCFVGEVRYATVVRTTRVSQTSPPMVGLGMRFDQPLFF